MNGKGGVYIKRLIDDGALVEDFITELLGTYPLKECLDREAELSKTSLYPKGLNGNAGSYIEMTEAVREKISKSNRNRIDNGTHHLLGPETNRKRIDARTHNFLGPETNRKRIENKTHHLLGPETNLKRVENGTHNLQVKGMMTALNIETGEVHRISKELYFSRRDIYYTIQSKVFKEWKKNKG